jgi:D-3-phosphoglycerate dehydrogenase
MAQDSLLIGITRDALVEATGQPFFDPAALAFLDAPGIAWEYMPDVTDKLTAEQLARYDAICAVAPGVAAEAIGRQDLRTRIIARFGVGFDTCDVPALTDAGIVLTNNPDGVRRPMATVQITYVLALAQRLLIKDRLTREGRWNDRMAHTGTGLTGRVLGSIGLGNIGAELFRLARPFGMRHLATDPADRTAVAAELGVELTDRNTLLREADFIVVNCPLDASTRQLIGAREFALMKPSAIFINCARGPIVDEVALHAALVDGRIAAAGLDVFHDEPVPASNPLLHLDNVIVSPHALCYTDECLRLLAEGSFRRAVAFLRRERPPSILNPDVLRHPRVADWLG